MADDWLKELEQQLETECGTLPPKKKRPTPVRPNLVLNPPQKQSSGPWPAVFFVFLLGLVIVVGGLWLWQGNDLFALKKQPDKQEQFQQPEREPWEEPWRMMSADVQATSEEVEALKEEHDRTRERMDWIGSRLALLGALHSNNFIEAKKKGLTNAEFLLPDRHWQIDRLPDNLKMTDEDRERLGRFVKTEE